MPRCGLCHGLIDVNCESVFVEQLQKSFHDNHFKCSSCTQIIWCGDLYHVVGESVHCNDCYTKSAECFRCHQPLLSTHVQIGPDIYIHTECFKCDTCNERIQGAFCEIGALTQCMPCFKLAQASARAASSSAVEALAEATGNPPS